MFQLEGDGSLTEIARGGIGITLAAKRITEYARWAVQLDGPVPDPYETQRMPSDL